MTTGFKCASLHLLLAHTPITQYPIRWSSGVDILRFAYYTTNADGIDAMIQDETGQLTRFVAQLHLV